MASYFTDHAVDEEIEEQRRRERLERAREMRYELRGDAGLAQAFTDEQIDQIASYLGTTQPGVSGPPPASKKAIDALPRGIVKVQGVDPCPVCMEHITVGTESLRLPCKHTFHPECVLEWLNRHCTCPMCRKALPTDDPEYEDEEAFKRIEARLNAEEKAGQKKNRKEDDDDQYSSMYS